MPPRTNRPLPKLESKLDEIYLENFVTRKGAFYHVELHLGQDSKYHIVVKWGKVGTKGQVSLKKSSKIKETAKAYMEKLVENKKLRNYHVAGHTNTYDTSTKKTRLKEKDKSRYMRFANLETL